MRALGLSQRRERLIARSRRSRTREREGAVLVEGVRAASEAIAAGAHVELAVTSPRLAELDPASLLAVALEEHGVVHVDDRELERLAATTRPQGVLLVCREPRASLERVGPRSRVLVLDGVQDPGNAGTLVRAAVAFALDAVLFLDGTVDPWGAKAVRASAGMVFRIPVVRASEADVRAHLSRTGVPLYVADPAGEDAVGDGDGAGFAVVLGNEGGGVRHSLTKAAAKRVAVRMPGPAESLNVAMAGAILLHQLTCAGVRD